MNMPSTSGIGRRPYGKRPPAVRGRRNGARRGATLVAIAAAALIGYADAAMATLARVSLVAGLQVQADAGRVALVIGNGDYEKISGGVLKNPVNDAVKMSEALRRLGFEVVMGTDLDRGDFIRKLGEFGEAMRGAEVALFFYAGYGLQVHGKNWLVPVDAELGNERDLDRDGVVLDTIMDRMQGKYNLVFLDACQDNPLKMGPLRSQASNRGLAPVGGKGLQGGPRDQRAGALSNRGLAPVGRRGPQQWFIGYGTEPGGVVEDGASENSPFTTALLKHIETPGESVPDMFRRVVHSTLEATGGRQKPYQASWMGGDPLFLGGWAPSPPLR